MYYIQLKKSDLDNLIAALTQIRNESGNLPLTIPLSGDGHVEDCRFVIVENGVVNLDSCESDSIHLERIHSGR